MKARDWDKDKEGEDRKTREPENRAAREGDRHHRGKSEVDGGHLLNVATVCI